MKQLDLRVHYCRDLAVWHLFRPVTGTRRVVTPAEVEGLPDDWREPFLASRQHPGEEHQILVILDGPPDPGICRG